MALQTLQPLESQAWGICVGRWVQRIQQGRPPVGRSLAGEHQLAARASRPAAGGWRRGSLASSEVDGQGGEDQHALALAGGGERIHASTYSLLLSNRRRHSP